MAWIWTRSVETETWGADLDDSATYPLCSSDESSSVPLDRKLGIPVFRSTTGLKKFRKFHCPPFSIHTVVDRAWRDIILQYVPASRIQFFPVRLVARGETTEEFSWVIPFDRVNCIDIEHSEITDKIEKPGVYTIFHMDRFCHLPTCMGDKHLARDKRMLSHLLVSDELKDALCATGESSMFRKPEDMTGSYSL
jgi:hypothetical protein